MSYENQIIYNNDNTVSVPFGRAAEWYIVNHPLLRNARLKFQSRLYVNTLIREGLIKLRRVEGATDYIEWKTSDIRKSTNRVDDIIELTEKGRSRVDNIRIGIEKDKLCWYWVMYCADDGNRCQHLCGGISTYTQFIFQMAQRLKMVCKKVMYSRRKRMKSLGNIKDELWLYSILAMAKKNVRITWKCSDRNVRAGADVVLVEQ